VEPSSWLAARPGAELDEELKDDTLSDLALDRLAGTYLVPR
jgi:hypothetical protein